MAQRRKQQTASASGVLEVRKAEDEDDGVNTTPLYRYRGKLHTIYDLMELPEIQALGLKLPGLRSRLRRSGTVARAIEMGTCGNCQKFQYRGAMMTREELCSLPHVAAIGITPDTFSARISRGWTITRALEQPQSDSPSPKSDTHWIFKKKSRSV